MMGWLIGAGVIVAVVVVGVVVWARSLKPGDLP
jgi:hypothetical protein